jgi:hypothetical protein
LLLRRPEGGSHQGLRLLGNGGRCTKFLDPGQVRERQFPRQFPLLSLYDLVFQDATIRDDSWSEINLVAGDFSVVKTFTAVAVEEDGRISENTSNKFIHCWFLEFAAVFLAITVELGRSFDFLLQKVTDIYCQPRSQREIPMDPSSPQSILPGIHSHLTFLQS